MFDQWELPTEIEIDGIILYLNTDYRDILRIIEIYKNNEYSQSLKANASLQIFIDNFEDIKDYNKAIKMMMDFIACGEPDKESKIQPIMMDWKQDYIPIVSGINKVAGKEIRSLKYLHWFTFISYFQEMGDGQFAYLSMIRNKIRKNIKLSKEEKEYIRDNREKIYLKQNATNEDEKKKLKERFG